MLKRNTNLKILAILALLCGATIPMPSAHAANGWEIDLNAGDEIAEASSVTITMGSATTNAMLFPESSNSNKAMAMIKRTASVVIGATDGYTIKVSGEPNLVGKNANNKIPSITANTTLAQMDNQWGWYSAEGDADCNTAQSLKQMNNAGETISSGALSAAATKNFTMCFGAKVNTSQAADSYSGAVMVSAVAEPRSVVLRTFGGITTMQEMTPAICKAANVNDTAYLRDTRDNKSYWVTKLLDGNCWMSQNLALDLGSTIIATYDSDPTQTFTWTVGSNGGMASIGQSGIDDNVNKYAWNLGNYVIINPTAAISCGSNIGLSACSGQFVAVGSRTPSTDPNFYQKNGATYTSTEYDAHYLAGNYYQWNAATAGTGEVVNGTNASGSICPKNWKLPSSATSASTITKGTYAYLLQRYGLASAYNFGTLTGTSSIDGNTYNIDLSPLLFVRGGYIDTNFQDFGYPGHSGRYWSSLSYGNRAYYLNFDSDSVNPSIYGDRDAGRYFGQSLRCLILAV